MPKHNRTRETRDTFQGNTRSQIIVAESLSRMLVWVEALLPYGPGRKSASAPKRGPLTGMGIDRHFSNSHFELCANRTLKSAARDFSRKFDLPRRLTEGQRKIQLPAFVVVQRFELQRHPSESSWTLLQGERLAVTEIRGDSLKKTQALPVFEHEHVSQVAHALGACPVVRHVAPVLPHQSLL